MRKLRIAYHVVIILLAIVSVTMAVTDLLDAPIAKEAFFDPLDTAILIFFAADYIARFAFARDKLYFFKHNIFDLIAIIPFNSIFAMFRGLRVLRIARLSKLAKLTKLAHLIGVGGRFRRRANAFLRMNGLIYVVFLNVVSVILGAFAIYALEKGVTVKTFPDAIWWAFVTATTVGYGDISPVTAGGRIVAAVLMIFGIGLVSMLTGTIASYFSSRAMQTERQARVNELKELAEGLDEEQLEALIEEAKQADEQNRSVAT